MSQAINTLFAEQRRDITAQAELQTVRYAVTELSSGYEHLIEDLDAAGFKVDPAFLGQIRQSLREAYERGPMLDLRNLGEPVGDFDQFSDLSPAGFNFAIRLHLEESGQSGIQVPKKFGAGYLEERESSAGFPERFLQDDVRPGDGPVPRFVRDGGPAQQLFRFDVDR